MTRFFMEIDTACSLILTAGKIAVGREIFILKMPAFRLRELAEAMIAEYAPAYGHKPEKIKIKIIGKRNGEKLHEDLMAEEEADRTWERKDMFLIIPHILDYEDPLDTAMTKGFRKTMKSRFSSQDGPFAGTGEIRRILRGIGTGE